MEESQLGHIEEKEKGKEREKARGEEKKGKGKGIKEKGKVMMEESQRKTRWKSSEKDNWEEKEGITIYSLFKREN